MASAIISHLDIQKPRELDGIPEIALRKIALQMPTVLLKVYKNAFLLLAFLILLQIYFSNSFL